MNSKSCSYKILLIDDDKEVRSVIKSTLEMRNHVVTTISNGKDALQAIDQLEETTHDLILLDINLPGASGWEILAKIRANSNTHNYPVIMLTGVDDESSESQALLDGADDYIVKPCSTKLLMAHIEANIRKKTSISSVGSDLPKLNELEPLTEREVEILKLIVRGLSNKEIADQTFISEQTVISHIKNISKKFKVNNRLKVAVIALKYNLI